MVKNNDDYYYYHNIISNVVSNKLVWKVLLSKQEISSRKIKNKVIISVQLGKREKGSLIKKQKFKKMTKNFKIGNKTLIM